MKRLLVTGRDGFVGSVIARMVRSEQTLSHWHVLALPHGLDLRERSAISDLVAQARPDAVVHLAAQSWVPESTRDPETTLQVNVLGTLHLLQALSDSGFSGRMLLASTGEVYGTVAEQALPIGETHLPFPRNPYAVSKLAAEALCRQWTLTSDIEIVVARAFNHIGAGQSDRFVVADFARQIARIKLGLADPEVHVGDIDVTRDFTDVTDVVRAYFALLERGDSAEIYNVCSGHETSIRSILHTLADLARVSVEVVQEPGRMRRAEQRRMRGDPGKLMARTLWGPRVALRESLASMLQHCENELANG